ncbi:MAG: hypothetical protein K5746_02660 [Clostridiales bacterium]|nr:hypothetical protein [Clostridiales bacterium]
MAIPVYLFAGFLESGKTSFIASVLQDPGFTQEERSLLVQCEEGIEEFEPAMLKKMHTVVEGIEDEDDFSPETLRALVRKHHPDRVLIEMNGMWDLDAALSRIPGVLQVYQIITTVNAATFELYAANMGQRMLQHISDADMVVFNRATEETRKLIRDRNVRSMNPQASMYFENDDGTSEDYGAGLPPPYDMEAPVIDIEDSWFGIFYLDASENPEKYDGKTVRFKGETYRGRNIGKDEFVPGRMAMVCCAEDVRFVGFIAKTLPGVTMPRDKTWNLVTAKIRAEERPQYRGVGPVLYVTELAPAIPPEEEVVTFNR